MISTQRLKLAGWLSIAMAILSIPTLILSVAVGIAEGLGVISGFGARAAIALLTVINVVLYVYVFSTLRVVLEDRYAFRKTSGLITILIVANVVIAALSVLSIASPAVETATFVVSLLATVPFGIIFIVFAVKLLQLPHNLYGMLKPFSYTSIATGFCSATIVLIPIGILTSAVSNIILAIIFFRSIDEMRRGHSL